MFNMDQKKQKILTIVAIVLLAAILFSIVVINFDSFVSFFAMINGLISVINSVFIGIIIAYLLNPIEKFFVKKVFKNVKSNKAHKALSILCTYLLVLALISAFLLISIPQIVRSINEMPAKLHDFALDVTEVLQRKLVELENSDFVVSLLNSFNMESLDVEQILADLTSRFVNMEAILQTIANSSLTFITAVYVALKDLLLGFILSIYFLAAKDRILANAKKGVTAMFGEKRGHSIMSVCKLTNKSFGGFIQGKLINAVIIGILTWICFVIFKIPYPMLLAIIIAITDIIPVFGPFIGAIPSAFIVLISAPEKLILMILLIIIIQQVDGNYIGPKILGESTGLSALGVFLAIIIMGGYFGIIGMIIGVPTFAVLSTLLGRAVDRKLAKQGLSTDISDYYNKYSLEDSTEDEHKNLFTKIVDAFADGFKKIIRFIKKLPKIRKRSSLIKKDAPANEEEKAEVNNEQI